MVAIAVSGKIQEYEETDITVATGTTTIQTISCGALTSTTCYITVKNSHGTVAWDAFNIAIRSTTNAAFVTQANSAIDFTSPTIPLIDASASPTALLAGASVMIRYDISGIDAIRLQASGDGAASTAEVYFHFGSH